MKPEERCKKFSKILQDLVEISGDAQIERREASLDIKAWAKEFCTIRLTCSRQAGHTTAALNIIKNKFDKCIFVSPNHSMSGFVKDKAWTMNLSNKIRFVTSNNLDVLRGDGEDYDAIIVDCSWSMSKKSIDEIYSLIVPMVAYHRNLKDHKQTFFFIFLQ